MCCIYLVVMMLSLFYLSGINKYDPRFSLILVILGNASMVVVLVNIKDL